MELGISQGEAVKFLSQFIGFSSAEGTPVESSARHSNSFGSADLKASSALSATSPAPTTRNLH